MMGCGIGNFTRIMVEGIKSLAVTPGLSKSKSVALDESGISSSKNFMLVNLNDTKNWPHKKRGHIIIQFVGINTNPTTAFRGDVIIGVITAADDDGATLLHLNTWHSDQTGTEIRQSLPLAWTHFEANADGESHKGKSMLHASLSLGAIISSVDPNEDYSPEVGDIICRVAMTAGAVDVGLIMVYEGV